MERLSGYRGVLREKLQSADLEIGDAVKVESRGFTYTGTLMPRSELDDDKHLVVKLASGYNVGIRFESTTTHIIRLGQARKPSHAPTSLPAPSPSLPKVSILGTGGTIASRVDYFSGRVYPATSAGDLYSVVPELSDTAAIDWEVVYSVFSEDIAPDHWSELSGKVAQKIRAGAHGVVITHGTDTMGYSSAALSFALGDLPVPVILVGSQRSSDRPSSDASLNLVAAVTAAARASFAEVVVAMHGSTSDTDVFFHRGTKVRKCHTSSRWAFESVNASPIARFVDEKLEMLTEDYNHRTSEKQVRLRNHFDSRVSLLKFHPGMNPELIDWMVDAGYRGIVLEGTGLGHVSQTVFDSIRKAVDHGVVVAMTSQCIWGRVHMKVYRTGLMLLRIGVIPLEDMLSETALVKLMWSLGQAEGAAEVTRLLTTDVAWEIAPRTLYGEMPKAWTKQ